MVLHVYMRSNNCNSTAKSATIAQGLLLAASNTEPDIALIVVLVFVTMF